MKITFLLTGKTNEKYLESGIDIFHKRLKHYVNFEIITIPDLKNTKNLSTESQNQKEGELILNKLSNPDFVVLLDDKGKEYTSVDFSKFINKHQVNSTKHLVFVIGGAYGFSQGVYKRANTKFSLSKMTFSHQMVRLIFVEQLYRSYTILKGEPYHHN